MASTSKAVLRLQKDLKKLVDCPLVGANARPLEHNIMTWYAIVVGADGTSYAGIPIRFVMEFDKTYPDNAPKAFFETDIRYTGGATFMVNGRMGVCLNLFGNFGHIHTEWKSIQGSGWTPSYDITAILVSMQGLLMSDMLSSRPEDITRTIESAKVFKCPVTGHIGSDPLKWYPPVDSFDIFLSKGMEKSVTFKDIPYDPLRDHYVCFTTHSSIADGAMMGFGIDVIAGRGGGGIVTSTCEYTSKEAYMSGIRRSSTNKAFKYWLPILISSDKWALIKEDFIQCI